MLLCEAYRHEKGRQGAEEYLSFKPQVRAGETCGIFPLVNKEGMPEVAEKTVPGSEEEFHVRDTTPKQAIGKRYARMDEIGTPLCVTIDGQTMTDQTVTVRHRDDMRQERVALDRVKAFVRDQLDAAV